MILEELKQLKTGPRELRKFGLLVGGVFTGLGLLYLWRGKPVAPWFLTGGSLLLILGTAFPKGLKQVYLAWMFVALILGTIVSHVLLTLLFYVAIAPLGIIARLAGKDFLRLKLNPDVDSYWIRRERESTDRRADYERQF